MDARLLKDAFEAIQKFLILAEADKLTHSFYNYLRIAVEKTAGPKEWEAWEWLMAKIAQHKVGSLA